MNKDWQLARDRFQAACREFDLLVNRGTWFDPSDSHYVCPCGRRFLNNISCPRCGWMMPRLSQAQRDIEALDKWCEEGINR